jgi:hypothetical protein
LRISSCPRWCVSFAWSSCGRSTRGGRRTSRAVHTGCGSAGLTHCPLFATAGRSLTGFEARKLVEETGPPRLARDH